VKLPNQRRGEEVEEHMSFDFFFHIPIATGREAMEAREAKKGVEGSVGREGSPFCF
jgi:hypothetical protein